MLTHIHIRDFAIIDELELELLPGMTALTGETGAGKSILLDAIGLVLGDKADSSSVRHGAQKAEITLCVDIRAIPHAKQWLEDKALESDDNECILRRIISASGKSRATINGSQVNLTQLRELGEQMVDIHGQHEHQSLMKRDAQRQMLDDFANNEKLLENLRNRYQQWKKLHTRLQELTNNQQQHQERIDLLRFQTGELNELALSPGESEQLDETLNRLSNAEELRAVSEQGYSQLYDDENALYSQLGQYIHQLEAQASTDNQLIPALELLQSCQIQLQEAAYLLRDYGAEIELDPEALRNTEQRFTDIRAMTRKYRLEPEQLIEYAIALQAELEQLDGSDYDLDSLQQQVNESAAHYQLEADKLTAARQKAAKKLSKGVTDAMQELGMQGGQFNIQVTANVNIPFNNQGQDQIEFMVSANPGQPLKQLTKVASGGELSRISLAIQMMAAQQLTLPALIFDEVDSGIGGGTAEIVGKQLRQLSVNRQVFCVTHLPQVASKAHQHYQVSKTKDSESTATAISQLNDHQRVEEISRMIGGLDITTATRNLAKEMLQQN